MLANIAFIVIGLVGLLMGGEWLIRSASRLATSLGVPTLVIGLTVVALGTSMPELVVSFSAALGGVSDIALGNVVGSNIANLGLILGLAGLAAPLMIHATLVKREIPVMVVMSILVFIMALDGQIHRLDGAVLLISYVIFTITLYRANSTKTRTSDVTKEVAEEVAEEVAAIEGEPVKVNPVRELVTLIISIGVLIVGAQFIVNGAVNIARTMGISELLIGLTLVSIGTSLPEIATSVIASLRGHSDFAAGNVIGSNIANLLVILGATSVIQPIPVPIQVIQIEMPVMIIFAVAIIPLVLNRRLERWQAALLLSAYLMFLIYVFLQN
jgi:cation:H+ antiporter